MTLSQFAGSLLLITLLVLKSGCTSPSATDFLAVERERSSIQNLLDAQVTDWNTGDIDAFMTGYWMSDSLRFASGNAVREGWQETLERYKTAYPDKAAMGELSIELYGIHVLSHDAATVFGRFNLKREEPLDDLTGLFTLILRKKEDRWMIVHDHTSS